MPKCSVYIVYQLTPSLPTPIYSLSTDTLTLFILSDKRMSLPVVKPNLRLCHCSKQDTQKLQYNLCKEYWLLFATYAFERWRNSTQLKCGSLGRGKTPNMFWRLIFNSNEKMSCYCCVNLRVCFRWGRVPLCFSTNITKPVLGLLPPQITSLASESTQNECALPPVLCHYQRGTSWHIPKSGETQPRPDVPGDLRVSHNDSVSKEILPLLPQPRRAFDLPLSSSLYPSSIPSLCCFLEILIKRKDRDDECEVVPPDDRRRWTVCLNLSLI